jgi:hypothetical protein
MQKRPVRDLNRSFLLDNYFKFIVDEMLLKIKIPTPVDIAISATLKIALKKVNSFPPQIVNW